MIKGFVIRFWDNKTQTGVTVTEKNRSKIDVIFVREDGWSIGCEIQDFDAVDSLWKDNWVCIIEIRIRE
jgi:hypothetical protein